MSDSEWTAFRTESTLRLLLENFHLLGRKFVISEFDQLRRSTILYTPFHSRVHPFGREAFLCVKTLVNINNETNTCTRFVFLLYYSRIVLRHTFSISVCCVYKLIWYLGVYVRSQVMTGCCWVFLHETAFCQSFVWTRSSGTKHESGNLVFHCTQKQLCV